MRIAIGALVGSTGGPRTYAYQLIEQLVHLDHRHEILAFTDQVALFDHIERLHVVSVPLRRRSFMPWWDYISIPRALRRHRVDIYHNTREAIPWRCPCRAVMTIHDLAPFVFPNTFTLRQRLYLQRIMRGSVRRATRILTVSKHSRTDMMNLLHVPAERIRVIYNGITDRFHVIDDAETLEKFRRRRRITTPVLLYLGTIQPRKNVDMIIRAFAKMKREQHIPHHLYIVGRRGWLSDGLEHLTEELDVRDTVVFTGTVPDEDIPLFYNIAQVFIAPSSYEGFGLSLLEAMACGVPVVTTDISSIPEVVGDAAVTVAPRDAGQIADGVNRLLHDPALRSRCIERGLKRAALFHWRKAAEEILAVYEEIWEE